MKNYNFKTKKLSYGEIGWKILNYYDLGYVIDSDFEILERDKPREHYIIGTKGMIEFISKVIDDDYEYVVSIFEKRIVRR